MTARDAFSGHDEPRVVVTLSDPKLARNLDAARARNMLYLDAVARAGGHPVPLVESDPHDVREAGLAEMDGLLLSGGADLDPALYGEAPAGATDVQPGRDGLDLAAWRAAGARRVPVLGICRGFQAMNVFMGGRLVQHLDGHRAAQLGEGPVVHALRLVPGSRLARVLRPTDPAGGVLRVNSFHHQAIRREDLAPGLVAAGLSPDPEGDLVEAAETEDSGRLVIGVQCHPERVDTTPPEFERLFRVFVDAARAGARLRRRGRPE